MVGNIFHQPRTIGNLAERTVMPTHMGLSKTFSITGWRLGYAIAPEHMSPAITLVNDLYYVCSPTPLQHGVAAGFNSPQSYFDDLQTTYQKKRDLFCSTLTKARIYADHSKEWCLLRAL